MKKSLSLLLVEDNLAMAKQITTFLEGLSWQVDYASTVKQGTALALSRPFDVVILDLNLPDGDGLTICEAIKSQGDRNTPVLMLTARDAFEDKAKGFGKGADDYLTKPFDFRELALRCEAMARRPQLHTDNQLTQGKLSIDTRSRQVSWQGNEIHLTKVGFQILHKLVEAYPYPVSRSDLLTHIWGDEPPQSNALKSHLYALRKALDAVTDAPVLHTLSSVGYQLKGLDNEV